MGEVERVLVVGQEITGSCNAKFARGAKHLNDLAQEVQAWSDAGYVRPGIAVSPDRREVQFNIAEVLDNPPLEEWSLQLGDGIHAYRSGLDILAGELCRLDGKVPQDPRRVYFPIVDSVPSWTSSTPWLSMPPEILDRIEHMQPYHYEKKDESLLLTLHRLDIRDKHNGIIEASAALGDINTQAVMGLEELTQVEMQRWSGPVPLTPGHPISRFILSKPLLPGPDPVGHASLDIQFTIVHGTQRLNLLETCRSLVSHMPGVLSYILDGQTPAGWATA